MSRSTALAALALAGAGLLLGTEAQAHLQAFSPGTLIIPMDACYQAAPDEPVPAGCTSGKAMPDDGALRAYGLVHRLLQRGVSVYLAIDGAKGAIDAPDFTVVAPDGQAPVLRLDRVSDTTAAFLPGSTITYRGGPMLIAAEEAERARALMKGDAALAPYQSTAVHVAAVTFNAEVALHLEGPPPRLAIFDPCSGVPGCAKGGPASSEGIPVMRAYLRRAGLDQPGDVGTFGSAGRVADVLGVGDVVYLNALVVGSYQVLWVPHYLAPTWTGADYQLLPEDLTALLRLTGFVGAGGVLLGQGAVVLSLEGGNDRLGNRWAPPPEVGRFLFSDPAKGALNLVSGCYPGNAAGFQTAGVCASPRAPVAPPAGRALAFDEPANPLGQIGDFHLFNSLSVPPGANVDNVVGSWRPLDGGGWSPAVAHLARSSDADATLDKVDIYSLVRTPAGQVLYLGGQSYAEPGRLSTAGARLVLGSLLFSRPTRTVTEQARSGPIVAADGTLYQGSYRESGAPQAVYSRAADAGRWVFPQVLGHLREYPPGRFPAARQEALGASGWSWDAATRLPPGPARRVLTQVGGGGGATFIDFTVANRDQFKSRLELPGGATGADYDGLITAVRAGRLGGIDRSTPALVPPTSLVPGGATRPTVLYVGARDGQLHAFAVAGAAVPPGTELWSFIPAEQLPRLRSNSAGVDGSPNVRDLFDDWSGTGLRSWRTYLAVPAGAYGKVLSAIDVTDPTNPRLRFERGNSGVTLGNARGATWCMVNRASAPGGLAGQLVVASNQATGGPGIQVHALLARDGRYLWSFDRRYTRKAPGSDQVIPNEMPGPPAVVDLADRGSEDRVYVADFEGRIWELDAATGQSLTGDRPLYDVGPTPQGNVQPIGAPLAVYRDALTRHVVLVAATGGADWASPGDSYAVYLVDVEAVDPQSGRRGRLLARTAVPGRVYAAPTVAGNDVYVLTSAGALGGSLAGTLGDGGAVVRINLGSGQVTLTRAAGKGAGALLTTGDGRVVGATVRDIVALDNAGRDVRSTRLFDLQRLVFRAWLEPL